jgi:putative hydroxymethylpyrimidine transport system ATP-binding protein
MIVTEGIAPGILFTDICLSFEGKVLFDHLSFAIEGGCCTCILGPSGCGKSTLLRLVSGNTAIAFSGSIAFTSDHHGIGWMSQNDLLLPWMTLVDNIMLGAKLRGVETPELRAGARKLLREAGLHQQEKALPATLSGGMRQRAALLRTLMEDCPILLMDEPFSALDALSRLKLQNLAATMTRGKTVLLVTHDPMEALRMGDAILVLSGEPIRPISFKGFAGAPPRLPADPLLSPIYRDLLNLLMDEQPA